MKTKNTNTRRELLIRLLEEVNSQEEYEYLQSELQALGASSQSLQAHAQKEVNTMENEFENARAFTVADFIEVFRPDGKGHIVIEDFEGIIADIDFEDVICDMCNASIVQPEDHPERAVVFVTGTDALCEDCMHRIEDEGEEPSLLHHQPAYLTSYTQKMKGGEM